MSPEDVQMANKDVKRCFKSLAVREVQIKTVRYYIYPVLELKAYVERNTGKQITKEGSVVDP